ncbi:MAG: antitoxin [Actinomycetota bacterium]|nr:antitoxin [Actinomycetota bacterium]
MRTTLTIDDDVLQAARALARAEGRSVGEVLSELARRGLRPASRRRPRGGFPTFSVPADAAPITPDDVARALDEEP